ncbi:MAG: type VI secretion system Vgr family protein [Paracoccaceae bacterium]
MNAPFKQDARMGRLSTALGKDVLNLLRFEGEEHLNALFSYRIEALSARDDLDFDALIGTHATVHLHSFDLPEVPFDGVIVEAQLLGAGENGWRYELILKPWFWLLSLRRKQQIYHEKTVVQILDEVFAPWDKDVKNRLAGDYPVLEYTVQYRESDLAFATRLMERFGINYHFAHQDGAHALVLTDDATQHDPIIGEARPCLGVNTGHSAMEEHFWDMRPARRLTTGAIRLTDYNFKTPTAAMEAERTGDAAHAQGQIESYDYPGDYLAQGVGNRVARLRSDQERGQDARHRALGDCASLRAGCSVKVIREKAAQVSASMCLSAHHSYTSGGYGSTSKEEATYEGRYLLMPVDAPLRPEVKTPRALVQGPQTATVVGDGEIDCDEFGRILVRFHWDLDKRFSMRCRVSQNWAGKGWGGMVIPRIGMEVVVEFLEGDPDKPLVTGCVYNGKNDVPYELPKHKTRSTFKTETHKGRGFNELRFEDEKGREEIFTHAQKDVYTAIEDSAARIVGNNDFDVVQNSQFSNVAHLKDHEVGWVSIRRVGFADIKIISPESGVLSQIFRPKKIDSSWGEFDIVKRLSQIKALSMAASGTLEPYSSITMIAGSSVCTVGKDLTQRVGGNHDLTIVGSQSVDVEGRVDLTAEETMTQTAGDNHETYAGEAIVLAVGEASIAMTKDGDIEIAGRNIKINGQRIDLN